MIKSVLLKFSFDFGFPPDHSLAYLSYLVICFVSQSKYFAGILYLINL